MAVNTYINLLVYLIVKIEDFSGLGRILIMNDLEEALFFGSFWTFGMQYSLKGFFIDIQCILRVRRRIWYIQIVVF